ncbi:MAG: hypothetical protein KDD56_03620 [Bdellovibrionales bacterium]|nr:hypothetical protein [Bdellovibrionales bacterium]
MSNKISNKLDLAAKQKRLLSWAEFTEKNVKSIDLKLKIGDALKDYRNLLAKCWENRDASDSDLEKISSLERELSMLNEEARMTNEPVN